MLSFIFFRFIKCVNKELTRANKSQRKKARWNRGNSILKYILFFVYLSFSFILFSFNFFPTITHGACNTCTSYKETKDPKRNKKKNLWKRCQYCKARRTIDGCNQYLILSFWGNYKYIGMDIYWGAPPLPQPLKYCSQLFNF